MALGDENRSDRRLPMRRCSLWCRRCRPGHHLPLPDVPEGDRAVALLADIEGDFGLDPRTRSDPPRSWSAIGHSGDAVSFRRIDGQIEIMTGALRPPGQVDRPGRLKAESRLGWVVVIANLPSQTTLQNHGSGRLNGIVSAQHPDRDRRVQAKWDRSGCERVIRPRALCVSIPSKRRGRRVRRRPRGAACYMTAMSRIPNSPYRL